MSMVGLLNGVYWDLEARNLGQQQMLELMNFGPCLNDDSVTKGKNLSLADIRRYQFRHSTKPASLGHQWGRASSFNHGLVVTVHIS
jgi:hypothetical protein